MKANKLIVLIVALSIIGGGYFIKQQYYFPGYKYVGQWVSLKSNMNIAREGDHFIITVTSTIPDTPLTKQYKIEKTRFFSGNLDVNDQLKYKIENKYEVTLIYLSADDAIVEKYGPGQLYFKRSQK